MRSFLAKLALLLMMSGIMFAREKSSSTLPPHSSVATRKLTVSGRVSHDGKTLLADLGSEWVASNADALKGHEGCLATLKCSANTERNRMRIFFVKKGPGEPNDAERTMDSAFRR